MTDAFKLLPIGIVRSPFKTTHEIPLQGGPATLEISPEYADGLLGLEGSSHLMVMGCLHLADRSALRVRTVKFDPHGPPKGVFATRSPARPNPVSLTLVPLLSRDGLRLEVDHLDLVDGTPLIDLKPYAPGWDSAFCARHVHRAPPTGLDEQRFLSFLERDLANFMGPHATTPAARWGLAATFVGARALQVDPRDPSMTVLVNRNDATTEALMALTGAALFNQRLATAPDLSPLRVRFSHGDSSVELVAAGNGLSHGCDGWATAFKTTVTEG